MKKTLLLVLITSVSIFAYGKGGGSKPMTAERFIHESLEDSMFLAKNAGAGAILFTSTELVAQETLTVTITDTTEKSFVYQCILVDDISQSGTVVKKEPRCSVL